MTEKLLRQRNRFHKSLKTFTKLYYRYEYIVYKYNYTCRDLTKKGISHPCFYGDFFNIDKMVKSDTSNLVKYMINLIRKGYDLATIVDSLMQVYFAKKIETL